MQVNSSRSPLRQAPLTMHTVSATIYTPSVRTLQSPTSEFSPSPVYSHAGNHKLAPAVLFPLHVLSVPLPSAQNRKNFLLLDSFNIQSMAFVKLPRTYDDKAITQFRSKEEATG